MSTALFQAAHAVEAEPLLACVTAGMLLANRRCGAAAAEAGWPWDSHFHFHPLGAGSHAADV
jgi:hypothetical protein